MPYAAWFFIAAKCGCWQALNRQTIRVPRRQSSKAPASENRMGSRISFFKFVLYPEAASAYTDNNLFK